METDIIHSTHDLFSRRNFLGQAGLGVGAAALASLLPQQGLASAKQPKGTEGTAFRPQNQTGYLFIPEWRTLATRNV